MKPKRFAGLRADIQLELANLERLVEEVRDLPIEAPANKLIVRGVGSILHDFYSGAEKIFQLIALNLDANLPRGEDWHAQLLRRMSASVPDVRPPVITPDLGSSLSEYLSFRQLFRSVYGFEFKWRRLRELADDVPGVYSELHKQIVAFLSLLTDPRFIARIQETHAQYQVEVADLAALYAEFADEDIALAEAGLEDYAASLAFTLGMSRWPHRGL